MFGLLGLITGIILLILGGYMVFFFPHAIGYQTEKFSAIGIIAGFVFLLIGALLIFIPG